MPAALYVVATPLGHLSDITRRAIEVLGEVDIIACEDTRVTRRLLAALGVAAPRLVRYDDHADDNVRARLIEALSHGKSVALASDAGTPLIADPGFRLVREAHAAGVPVIPVPGPSALTAALSVAGLPTDRFLFAGFLPAKAAGRAKALAEVAALSLTLVFFEAPHRLKDSLAAMAASLGPREAAVLRELTKRFEEIRRGRLDELARDYASAAPPLGEVVIVVGPPREDSAAARPAAELDQELAAALERVSLRDAVAMVAAARSLPRREVYARALELSRRMPADRRRR